MPGVKQASKRKRVTKAVPALGAVGLTSRRDLYGGRLATAVPTVTLLAQTLDVCLVGRSRSRHRRQPGIFEHK